MIAMNLPEYLVTDFLVGRYERLASPLSGIYVRELVRFTDTVDTFLKIFPEKDQFIATLFFEQDLNPMLKAYTAGNKILELYIKNENEITNARNTLEKLCANSYTNSLLTHVKNIENLENNQKNLQDNFYYTCAVLYPNRINTNVTTFNPNIINNNIHHIS